MCCAAVVRLAVTLHASHLQNILIFCLRLHFEILCSSWTAKNGSTYLLILWQELFIFGIRGGWGVIDPQNYARILLVYITWIMVE
jgi:hypothetical protein